MKSIKALSTKALLIILDGFGINPNTNKNAIRDAKKPYIDSLFANYPMTTIKTAGLAVGLPEGVMGNSEVGHLNIGAGRRVRQDLVRINETIENKQLGKEEKFQELITMAKKNSNRVHLVGLLSDGGVHSHIDHIKAIIQELKKEKINVFLHAMMDGRDTERDCGHKYVKEIQKESGVVFASMQGRAIGMDRDKRYEKTEHAYKTLTGQGEIKKIDPYEYIQSEYKQERYDEFITPVLFDKSYAIKSDDVVFFVNYRPDRAIQLTQAFTLPNYPHFKRDIVPAYYLCMTPYIDDEIALPILFDKETLVGGLSEYISSLKLAQFKTAETEKFAHVTFFFNGGRKEEFPLEDRVLIPSPKEVKTYDQKPQMSAPEVTDALLKALDDSKYSLYTVNYANSDMVGHTGNYEAAIKAIETLDKSLERVVEKCLAQNITVVITADHGNSDQMVHPDGKPHTAHTTADAPFCVVHKKLKNEKIDLSGSNFALQDIAPTLLYIMGLKKPNSMEGNNIFI